MSQFALLFPMLALVLLTFGVAVALFRARKRSVREGHTPVSYFRTFQGSREPEFLAQATRHFSNLFETPTLFYAGCLAGMVADVTGGFVVAVAAVDERVLVSPPPIVCVLIVLLVKWVRIAASRPPQL